MLKKIILPIFFLICLNSSMIVFAGNYTNVKSGYQVAIDDNLMNPTTAWRATNIVYQGNISSTEFLPFQIRLENLIDGDEANTLAYTENKFNDAPEIGQQWIIMKFFIKNTGTVVLRVNDVFNYATATPNFFNKNGAALVLYDTCTFSNSKPDIYDVQIYPGASSYFWMGILVDKSEGYPIIRLNNGKEKVGFSTKVHYTFLDTNPTADDKIIDYVCNNHVFTSEDTIEATCTASGKNILKCARCGFEKTEIIPATGHDFEYDDEIEATCTASGKNILKCTKCDAEKTEIIPATGHDFKYYDKVEPTCTDLGTNILKCSGCGIKKTESIPAKGHEFSAWGTTKPSTVFETGIGERNCTKCDKKETTIIDKLSPTIRLSTTKKTIKKKKSYTLAISQLAAGDGVKAVTTNKKAVTTVKKVNTNKYKITGKKKGKAVITVKLNSGKTAKCTITVK